MEAKYFIEKVIVEPIIEDGDYMNELGELLEKVKKTEKYEALLLELLGRLGIKMRKTSLIEAVRDE